MSNPTPVEMNPQHNAVMHLLESGEITIAEAARLRRISRQRIYAIIRRDHKLTSIYKARLARVNSLWRKTLDSIEG
jgi:predicted DNA-binding protein YlxM (UPF0122 family)